MIKHTFLNKCNTIIKDSSINTGLNPVVELNAGEKTTRILIHFDVNDIKNKVLYDGWDVNSLKHVLKMKNCGSVTLPVYNDSDGFGRKRASSFDIIAFKLPYFWDMGRGYDYEDNLLNRTYNVISKSGSTWFNSQTHVKWDEPGVYSYETLEDNPSLIVSKQHFDSGVEDLELDLTNYVNNIIKGEEENFGIGLMFLPVYEQGSGYTLMKYVPSNSDNTNTLQVDILPNEHKKDYAYILCEGLYYAWETVRDENSFISFFGSETNTFFEPYLETTSPYYVLDNRNNFHLGVNNKLYLFVTDNGEYVNLDELPICSINDIEYPVKQHGKGIYYIDVKIAKDEYAPYTILYDVWSHIILDGCILEDVEQEFVVLPLQNRLVIGNYSSDTNNLYPSIYGINESEKVKIGDVREVKIDFIEEYSKGKKITPNISEYRLYVKEGNREINIYPYQPLERFNDSHTLIIDTNELVPNKYYIDIRVAQGRSIKNYDKVLSFEIVSNVSKYSI